MSFFQTKQQKILGLVKYSNGSYSYISLIHGMKVGFFYKSTNKSFKYLTSLIPGYGVLLKNLKRFSYFCNLNLNNSCKYAKSPGTYCKLNKFLEFVNLVEIWLPTGKLKIISDLTLVLVGRNSNIFKKSIVYGKAGLPRKLGFRSNVRGVAMNPVDHPHGGRTKTNSPQKSVWGWIAKKTK